MTGGWFVGARVLSDATLGDGDPGVLVVTMFLATLTALAVGGLSGAAYVRFGARGVAALGIAVSAIVALALILFLPAVIAALAAFQPWWLVVVAAVLTVLATAGEYVLLRRASVR